MRNKLLLADDSVTIQRVIEQTFADEPLDVATVSDGVTAIGRLDTDPPDIVLADIGMPGRDGYDVAMHVRRTPSLAHIPVILLTGAFDPVDHTRVREAGCAGVLVKPFDPQMLIARVRQLLGERRAAGAVRADAPSSDRLAAEAAEGKPHSAQAPDADRPVSTGPPVASAEARTADVDEYFARLDRAFANLEAASSDRPPDTHWSNSPGHPVSTSAFESAPGSGGEPSAAPDAALQHSGGRASPPAATAPPAVGGVDAQPRVSPTLGGAFAALLAIEQGQLVPEAVGGWSPLLPGDLVQQIASRVSREVSERVVRELAPGIVSELAERLVREEIARLTSGPRDS